MAFVVCCRVALCGVAGGCRVTLCIFSTNSACMASLGSFLQGGNAQGNKEAERRKET